MASHPTRLWRAVALGGHLALLAALWASLLLAAFDHHAAERDPLHDHLVVGIGWPDRGRFIASHRHAFEDPQHHEAVREEQADRVQGTDARAVAVRRLDGSTSPVVSLAGQELLTPEGVVLALAPIGRPVTAQAAPPSDIFAPNLEPPPRPSF